MTPTASFATVANSIAALSISGVHVFDIDNIPVDAKSYLPALFPAPDGFITGIQFTRLTPGTNGTAKMDLSYTLTYRFLHSIVGSGAGLIATYADAIEKLSRIVIAILSNDAPAGVVNMELESISNIGPMTDPAGQIQYIGAEIALKCLEYANG